MVGHTRTLPAPVRGPDSTVPSGAERRRLALAPLLRAPEQAGIFLDVDGTLAPIVLRPEEATVPRDGRDLLARLADRYALVACVSGRQAEDVRALVGVDSLTYVGNHGLERLDPGRVVSSPAARVDVTEAGRFARERYDERLAELGVRLEDKASIWSFHWRGARDEEAARRALDAIGEDAAACGLVPHWGRKVLEIRPAAAADKGTAVTALIEERTLRLALYAGDDRTDLDAFRALRALAANGLEHAACVAVASAESPPGLIDESDVVVEGTDGVLALLRELAG
jgi:trehalose 6-phosphate phosphatase